MLLFIMLVVSALTIIILLLLLHKLWKEYKALYLYANTLENLIKMNGDEKLAETDVQRFEP